MSARQIGEIIKPIVARCAALASFQELIGQMATPEARKEFIFVAAVGGLISTEEATLLMQVYQLETV